MLKNSTIGLINSTLHKAVAAVLGMTGLLNPKPSLVQQAMNARAATNVSGWPIPRGGNGSAKVRRAAAKRRGQARNRRAHR